MTQTPWEEIPHMPLGTVPDDLPEKEPMKYRQIVAKRALVASYECADDDPFCCIQDMLADLRHLCDKLGCSFAEADRVAANHYCEEIHDFKKRSLDEPES